MQPPDPENPTLHCKDFKALGAPTCCTSCHDDDEQGYVEMQDGEYKGQRFYCCCTVAEWVRTQERVGA